MHKRIKKMETGASIGNIIDLDMMKQLGLRLGDYNTFMNTSTNKIKSDIGNFKSSGFDLTNKNPFSNAKGIFSQNTVNSVNNWQNNTFSGAKTVNNLNGKFGGAFQMGDQLIGNLNTALVGNEKTGSTAQVMSGVKDIGHNVVSQFNPMGGMINTGAKTIGNLIGGTKDRVEGTGSQIQGMVSDGLSMLGPIGMAAGAALNLINGIGGKRIDKLVDNTSDISNEYSGSKKFIRNSIDKYSNKKAGLFDFGFHRKGQNAITRARRMQNTTLDITDAGKKRLNNQIGQSLASKNFNTYNGLDNMYSLAKNGMKFPELDEARAFLQKRPTQSTETQKFQLGGKMNLIPEGNLHAHKHHLENVNPELKDQITKKGIPVVAQSEGGIVQTAEIEKEEWTLRKEFTDKLEALYKAYQEDSSNEIAIEAGKLVCHELLKNTDDRSGLIKSVK